jgi:hypothetical protein
MLKHNASTQENVRVLNALHVSVTILTTLE